MRRLATMLALGALAAGCAPDWRELAARGDFVAASGRLREQQPNIWDGVLGEQARARVRGELAVHAFTPEELRARGIEPLPEALRTGRAVAIETTLRVTALAVPDLRVEISPEGWDARCCNLAVWARLWGRPAPKLPPEPQRSRGFFAGLKQLARGLGNLFALAGGVLADVTWLSTLGALDVDVGLRPSRMLRGRGSSARAGGASSRPTAAQLRARRVARELASLRALRRLLLPRAEADAFFVRPPKDAPARRRAAERAVDPYLQESDAKLRAVRAVPTSWTREVRVLYLAPRRAGGAPGANASGDLLRATFTMDLAPQRSWAMFLRLPPGPSLAARINAVFAHPLPLDSPRWRSEGK